MGGLKLVRRTKKRNSPKYPYPHQRTHQFLGILTTPKWYSPCPNWSINDTKWPNEFSSAAKWAPRIKTNTLDSQYLPIVVSAGDNTEVLRECIGPDSVIGRASRPPPICVMAIVETYLFDMCSGFISARQREILVNNKKVFETHTFKNSIIHSLPFLKSKEKNAVARNKPEQVLLSVCTTPSEHNLPITWVWVMYTFLVDFSLSCIHNTSFRILLRTNLRLILVIFNDANQLRRNSTV